MDIGPVDPAPVVVVLAAGEGTRMRSQTPKVLHELGGRPMVGHVLQAARALEPAALLVVVGHGRDQVTEAVTAMDGAARVVVQDQQHGTGHAVRIALDEVFGAGPAPAGRTVVVVPGDAPLLTGDLLAQLVATHHRVDAAATLLTAVLSDATGYGRVVRGPDGDVQAVTEHRDADEATLAVREVATSVYAFAAGPLREALAALSTDNASGEHYLTDVVGIHRAAGRRLAAVVASRATDTMGVNDRVQLAEARRLLRDRLVEGWMRAGVTFTDPQTSWLDVDVLLEPDCVVHPNTQLHARTVLRRGAQVGPDSTLTATEVGARAVVVKSHCDGAVIGEGATVGPYTHLRAGARIGAGAKAGAFVEVKNSDVGAGSKVPHLAYVGDATVGEDSNIGAGTIVVNYDGVTKHRTRIGDRVRIGSNNSLIAPVTIGERAYTAAGSVITRDVPAGSLGVGRSQQRNIEGWVDRRRHAAGAVDPPSPPVPSPPVTATGEVGS